MSAHIARTSTMWLVPCVSASVVLFAACHQPGGGPVSPSAITEVGASANQAAWPGAEADAPPADPVGVGGASSHATVVGLAAFVQTGPTSEGLTAVANYVRDPFSQNQSALRLRWGFIAANGAFITTPLYPFDAVQSFKGGFAGVAVDQPDRLSPYAFHRKWGFIGRNGQSLTGLQYPYDAVRPFSYGLAAIMIRQYDSRPVRMSTPSVGVS